MSRCVTWESIGRLRRPVLVVVNSRPDDRETIESTLSVVFGVADRRDVRVITPVASAGIVEALGVASDHIRHATVHGSELELNFFLEHEHALEWIARHSPRTILGTAPHNLYNEEVKDLFEQRVLMFLGDGTFLAHAVPSPYVYTLEQADLLERAVRPQKVDAYRVLADALLADFHSQWLARGAPDRDDDPDYRDVAATFARHFGAAVLDYDEQSRIPTPIAVTPSESLAADVRRARRLHYKRWVKARFF